VVIVPKAAKMARTIWAVTAKVQDYQRSYKIVRPIGVEQTDQPIYQPKKGYGFSLRRLAGSKEQRDVK